MLGGIETSGVDADDLHVLVLEDGPRSGCEILETSADRHNKVCLGCEIVGGLTTGHADRPCVHRVRCQQRRLTGHCLDHRDVVRFGEGCKFGLGKRIVHPTPGDDQRFPGFSDRGGRRVELVHIGARSSDRVHLLCEEADREVVGLGSHVLGQSNECRPAVARVEHRLDRMRQR